MGDMITNPPKHTCPKCQKQLDHHFRIGNYAFVSCPHCASTFSSWRSFAYFAAICWIIDRTIRLLGLTSASPTMLVGVFLVGLCVLVMLHALGNHIWTAKLIKINQ